MYCYDYPRLMLTVDAVVIKKENQHFSILLIKRLNEPFKDSWALPGGFIEMDETPENAVKRELKEETGLDKIELLQFRTYGDLDRDPRGRTVSIVYYGFINSDCHSVTAGDDAAEAKWFSIKELPSLAFDHFKIITELNNFLQLV